MAAGNKIPKITDFDTLQAYIDATLAMDGPPKSMGKIGPGIVGKRVPKNPQKGQKVPKTPQKGLSNG